MFDVAEEGHADDGVDEGDEGEQRADVEQRRQRHDQREQQLPDPLRSLMMDDRRREERGDRHNVLSDKMNRT